LSARGPIVDPSHDAIIFTPVAPHMLFDRSLVLGPERELRLEVIRDRPAALAIDGVTITILEPGDAVRCRRAGQPARLVVTGSNDFHRTLKTKFGLSDR
jgi:NAD+ kinase